jgi:hypothetical protein
LLLDWRAWPMARVQLGEKVVERGDTLFDQAVTGY